jgi:galactoside O-acetyltransferase
MINAAYSEEELIEFGFKSIGRNVQISRKASIYNPGAISLGHHVRIDDFCILSGGKGIKLGSFIHIGSYSALFGGAKITMKDFSGLSARVTIYSESDDYSGCSLTNPTIPSEFKPKLKRGKVSLGRHVIVGANSTILPGTTLEDGAAVGAYTLVDKDCQGWFIYVGCPARKGRARKKNLLVLEATFLKENSWQLNDTAF